MKKFISVLISVILISTTLSFNLNAYAYDRYESESNDSYSSANYMDLNSTIYGKCSSSSDYDWFKFVLDSAGKVDITFSHNQVSNSGYWYLNIYKYNGGSSYTDIISKTAYTYDDEDFKFSSLGLPAGTYFVRVDSNSDASNISYGVNVSYTKTNDWEKEFNDSYSSSNVISLNKKNYGVCISSGDYDWYKFTLKDRGTIDLEFTHPSKSNSGYWYVNIYKYNGGSSYTTIDSATVYCYDSSSYSFPTLGLPAGTYFVRVDSDSEASGIKYGITPKYTQTDSWEQEFNDSYSSSNALTIGKTLKGICMSSGDYDWYKFTLSNKETLNIKFTHEKKNQSGYWYVNVYKYNGGSSYSTLYSETVYLNDASFSFKNLGLDAGTYFVRVDSNSEAADYKYGVLVSYSVAKPSKLAVSERGTNSLKLSWNGVGVTSGYQLQQKINGSYKTLTNTTSKNYSVKNLKSATSYSFRVRAYRIVNGKKYYSSWKTLTTPTKPDKVSIKTPSTNSKHQIIVKWNSVARVSGYQVQYCKDSKCSNVIATKTVSGQSKTSYAGNNFTKGRTYYVRVRAYKTVSGTKYYGSWSSVKSIKCK